MRFTLKPAAEDLAKAASGPRLVLPCRERGCRTEQLSKVKPNWPASKARRHPGFREDRDETDTEEI